jgi:hypothetical protein
MGNAGGNKNVPKNLKGDASSTVYPKYDSCPVVRTIITDAMAYQTSLPPRQPTFPFAQQIPSCLAIPRAPTFRLGDIHKKISLTIQSYCQHFCITPDRCYKNH